MCVGGGLKAKGPSLNPPHYPSFISFTIRLFLTCLFPHFQRFFCEKYSYSFWIPAPLPQAPRPRLSAVSTIVGVLAVQLIGSGSDGAHVVPRTLGQSFTISAPPGSPKGDTHCEAQFPSGSPHGKGRKSRTCSNGKNAIRVTEGGWIKFCPKGMNWYKTRKSAEGT